MTKKVVNYYKRNNYVRWLTIVILLLSGILISGTVLSTDGKERNVEYGGDSWEMSNDFNKEWFFTGGKVTFEIDLSDDYHEELDEEELPFQLGAVYKGDTIQDDRVTVTPLYTYEEVEREEEEEQDGGEVDEGNDSSENGDGTEENAEEVDESSELETSENQSNDPDDGTNDGVDSDDGNDNGENEVNDNGNDDEENSGSGNGDGNNDGTGDGNQEEDEDDAPEKVKVFTGKYKVKIDVSNGADHVVDGVLDVTITFDEENSWEIPSFVKQFSFERDTQAPDITIDGLDDVEYNFYDEDQTLEIYIEDKNLDLTGMDIDVSRDGQPFEIEWSESEKSDSITIYRGEFKDNGDFVIDVTAVDKAGNQADTVSEYFTISKDDLELTVSNSDGVIGDGDYSRQQSVELEISHGINMISAKVEVIKDGELESEEDWSSFLGFGRKVVNLEVDLKDQGDYELRVTVEEREGFNPLKPGEKRTFSPFHLTVDSIKPQISLDGPIDGEKYNYFPNISVDVVDENLDPEEAVLIRVEKDGDNYLNIEDFESEELEEGTQLTYEYVHPDDADLEDGEYTLYVEATDVAGNHQQLNPNPVTFTIDTVKPEITISGVENGAYYNTPEVTIEVEDTHLDLENTMVSVLVEEDGSWIPYEAEIEFDLENDKKATAAYTFTEDGFYELKVESTDEAANTQEETIRFTNDMIAPELNVSGVSDQEKYNYFPNIDVEVVDVNLDPDESVSIRVEKDSDDYLYMGDFLQTDLEDSFIYRYRHNSASPLEDGEYTLYVEATDKAGNSNEITPNPITFTIDTVKPNISISGVEDGAYYNTPEVTIEVEDTHLDLDHTTVSVLIEEDGSWIPYETEVEFELENDRKALAAYTFTEDGIYELKVESTDEASNTQEETVQFTNDTIAPELWIDGFEDGEEFGEVLDGDDQIEIGVRDTNLELDQIELVVTRTDRFGNETIVAMDPLELRSPTEAINEYSFLTDGIYEIALSATDKAGNSAQHDLVSFTIDTTSPVVKIDGVDEKGNVHHGESRNVTITIEDLTMDLDEEKTSIEVKRDGKTYDANFSKKNLSAFKAEFQYTFDEEGTYDIVAKSKDRVGNKETKKQITFVIDKSAPEIRFSGVRNGEFIQNGKVKIAVTERYYESNEVTIAVTKDGKKYESSRFKDWENTSSTSTLELPFDHRDADGEYKITVSAKDKAGNPSSNSISFTLDNTKPVITLSEHDRFTNKNQTVSVRVVEDNYRNNDVTVQVTKRDPVSQNVIERYEESWENKGERTTHTYTFEEEYEYIVRVTATDAAGNSATAKQVTFTIDKQAPQLSIEGVESGEHYKSRGVNFRVSDTTLDISRTRINVTRDGKAYDIGNVKLNSGSSTRASLNYNFRQEGRYVVRFESTDKSGNKTTHDTINFVIDSTTPVVKIDGVDNQAYYPTDQRVTVSVDELNYETNDVELTVTKDGQPYNMGQWRNTNKLSRLSHQFTEDGTYNITITATDKAGNGPARQTMTFTIDKTDPEIAITGVENDAYYNTDRPVSVVITDTNLDINRITVTRDGANYSAGGFQVHGTNATFSHNFSQEGLYVIQVEAIDKAGNTTTDQISFTIDKTPPEITPMFSGENRVIENGEYINKIFTPNFVLTEPEDTIVSVTLNGSDVTGRVPTASQDMVYNYVVRAIDKAGNETTLEISFTLDITSPTLEISGVIEGYFNNNISPEVTYYDQNLDTSRTSVTLNGRPYENGEVLTDEGEYVLEAVVTDLADNVTSRTIVFTIDKTAPTIRFLEAISSQYFNHYLIPEFLIESLSPYEIIALTLNGNPYNIGDPIEEEGLHVLYFEVMDSAGNIQQLSVEFMIDLTPPTVLYEGVVENEVYYETLDVKLFLENQEDTFRSITVNGELFTGEVVDEDGHETISMTLTEIDQYEIVVEAYDKAGNETTFELPFEIARKGIFTQYYENTTLFASSIIGFLGAVTLGTTLVVRKRRKSSLKEGAEE